MPANRHPWANRIETHFSANRPTSDRKTPPYRPKPRAPAGARKNETIEFPFDPTFELAEELDLSICLDIGHVLVGFSGPFDLFEVLDSCLHRLGEIHLHYGPWQGPDQRIGYGLDHQPL